MSLKTLSKEVLFLKNVFLSNNKNQKSLAITLLIATLCLAIIGCVFVYSASFYSAKITYGDSYHFLTKQIVGVCLGVGAMLFMWWFDYHKLQKFIYVILGVGIAVLVLVLIPGIGIENYGARRWIALPGFTIQASEISKMCYIIFCAGYLSKNREKIKTLKGILPIVVSGGVTCVLILLEPNMSITICTGLIMMTMLFVGGVSFKHFLLLCIPAVLLVPILIIAEPYRLKRLLAFIDPWANPKGEGYQLVQSLYGFGAGGLFGVGLFNSRQKYLFLPFAESDFIFAIIAEEIGFVGVVCIVLLFGVILFCGIKIAKNAADLFGCFLAVGITALICIQVLVNIAVVTGSIPPTGLPLPFISAGSTSLIVLMGAIGVLCNVGKSKDNFTKLNLSLINKKT